MSFLNNHIIYIYLKKKKIGIILNNKLKYTYQKQILLKHYNIYIYIYITLITNV